MPKRFKDLTGERFGRLLVLGEAPPATSPRGKSVRRVNVRCDCGTTKQIDPYNLIGGRTNSCGCFVKDAANQRSVIVIGEKFGFLTVVARAESRLQPNGYGTRRFLVRCDCGTEKEVNGKDLRSGNTKSCGCLPPAAKTHGESRRVRSPEYIAWRAMINRCEYKKYIGYADYGGRGIRVCERWRHSLPNFIADMGRKPSPEHSLDRYPDNNGNYEPGNCRWATPEEQAQNKRPYRKRKVKDGSARHIVDH